MSDTALRARPAVETSAAMDASTAAAATLLEAVPSPCAVYCRDDDQLRFANQRFRDTFGSGDAISSRRVFEARFQRYAAEPAQSGSRSFDAFEPASNNWFSMQWSEFRWTDDSHHSMLMVSNTSARHAAVRDQVHERDKLLFTSRMMSVGEMASTIAHELNQPLAAIINYLSVGARVLESPDGIDDARSAIDMARTQAQHASAVIRHLREFVRAREPRRQRHRLGNIVDKVLQLTELDVKQSLVCVTHDCANELPDVLVDDVMIEQVLLNLIRNAIGAMREIHPMHRRIRVHAHVNLDDDVEVRVIDSGTGVSQSDESQLFEPLFTTKPDGLGIGLAICRSILEYHNGRLWFERDRDGHTVFALTLPAYTSPGEPDE